MAKTETAIAKKEVSYLASVEDIPKALGVLRENLGTEGLSRFDLPRIKVPAGGAAHLIMPDGEPSKTVSGIVVMQHMSRAYWPQVDGDDQVVAGQIPQCFSHDAVVGVGDPGGRCDECPMSRPGSGKGKRQACKLTRNMYFLLPGELLPVVLQVPPGSLKAARQFVLQQSSKGKVMWAFETKVGAKAVKNPAGQSYSELIFSSDRDLSDEEFARTVQYAAVFKESFASPEDDE